MIQMKDWSVTHNGVTYQQRKRYTLDPLVENELVRLGYAIRIDYIATDKVEETPPVDKTIREDLADEYTLDELRALADELDIDLKGAKKKDEVIDIIIASGRAEEFFA